MMAYSVHYVILYFVGFVLVAVVFFKGNGFLKIK